MFFAIIATSALFKTQSQMVEVQFEMARYDKEIVSIVRKLAGLPTPSPFAFRDAAVKATPMQSPIHVYEVRPRKDHRGVDLFPMPFHSVGCGMASRMPSRTQSATRSIAANSHNAVIRVYNAAGNVIETHEHKQNFKEC